MPTGKSFAVKFFGTGDGWPCADRGHASTLYRSAAGAVLIDCGEPVDRSFKASGLGYNAIDSIFISHLHADHIGGLFMLMQGFWLERRRKDLDIYLPAGAIKPLRQMFETTFIFGELLPFRLRLLPLRAGKPIQAGDTRVTPFRTSHLDGFRNSFKGKYRVDFNAFAFLVESGGKRVGHSADLGRPSDLEPLLARPLDLLVCELAHFKPEEIFGYLRGRRIKRVAFVHLARAYWDELAKTRRLADRMLPDLPHTFASDGQELAL